MSCKQNSFHHQNPAGEMSRCSVCGVFLVERWEVERGSTPGCLSLSCRRLASGLPSLHFLVNRLHQRVTWLPILHPFSPFSPGKGHFDLFDDSEQDAFIRAQHDDKSISAIYQQDGDGWFPFWPNPKFQFTLVLIPPSQKVIDLCIINNSQGYD